jgi:hypothetical protein
MSLEKTIKNRIKQLQDQKLKLAGTWIVPSRITYQIKELKWVLKLLKYSKDIRLIINESENYD